MEGKEGEKETKKRKEEGRTKKEGMEEKDRGWGADAFLVGQVLPITFHPYCVEKLAFSLISIYASQSIVFFF